MAPRNSKTKNKRGGAKAKAPKAPRSIVEDDPQYDPEPFETLPSAGIGDPIQLEGGVVDADGAEVQLSPTPVIPKAIDPIGAAPVPMTPEEAAIVILEKAGYEILPPGESSPPFNPRIARLGNRRETTYWVNKVSWFVDRIPTYMRRKDGLIGGKALDHMNRDVDRLIRHKCIAVHSPGSKYPTDPDWRPAIPAAEESNTLAASGSPVQ